MPNTSYHSIGGPEPGLPVLEVRAVSRRFGHVTALEGVNLVLHRSEIVALVGDNGAGKSTLVKILSGATAPDSGQILVDGQETHFTDTRDAMRQGISTTFQDLALATDLNSSANIYLGNEIFRGPRWLGWLDNRAMDARTAELLAELGTTVKSVEAPVVTLSGGQRQSVAVARAAKWATRVIILDEPSAALGVVQAEAVRQLIRTIRSERGIAVLLISHNMPEVIALADRVEVLRLGRNVARFGSHEADVDKLVASITGGYSNYPAAEVGDRS
jgi:simple sugar transport system ATP-binding protein